MEAPLTGIPNKQEKRKRKREIAVVALTCVALLFLTWFEIRLFNMGSQLPFVHSIFFFGLVNLNLILLLFLLFLIFRNVVKGFTEKSGKVIGKSLKGKLIAAFVTFSVVPTLLMFFISVFYINSSFDKWFSVKMVSVLKSSLEVTNTFYFNAKKRNYHYAHKIAKELAPLSSKQKIQSKLNELRTLYMIDSVEYYEGVIGERIYSLSEDESIPDIPPGSLEFLQKGLMNEAESSTIHQFAEGNLVRVIVPIEGTKAAVVVSTFVPLSLVSTMADIAQAYEGFRNLNPLEYPLKSIYLVLLVLMTLFILLAATWFGFYLAKQLSIPLVLLAQATKRVSQGDYRAVEVVSGSEEISGLVENFNTMTKNLEESEKEVMEANESLKETLAYIDKHSRYIEVVLKNVSTGVISVDQDGFVTTINRHAGKLLKIEPGQYLGRPVKELLGREYYRIFVELLREMQDHKYESLQKEMKVNVEGEAIPLQMNLSLLKDERNQEIGRVLVFDDLTILVNAQRAAAWTEVARRIAHEIKNPLTPIKLSAERLQKKFGSQINDKAFSSSTKMIIQQVDELRSLVNEFSQFARLPQARPIEGSLNQVIDDALVLYKSGHVDCEITFVQDLSMPDFRFDPEQIRRVLGNLIDNSLAAMDGQDIRKLSISTVYDSVLKIARLTVADNGPGIPKEDRSRVFEPYYTTKKSGTGLGLAIVKRIVEDHNGFIRAQGNDPSGTKIVIELPVVEAESWRPQGRESQTREA